MFKFSHLERIVLFSLLGTLALGSVLYMVRILLTPLPEIPPPIIEKKVRREVIPQPVAIPEPEILPEPEIITKPPPKPTPEVPFAPREVTIRITGAVNKPGVYRFAEGAKIVDAVKAAGGTREDALLDIMRLAQPLKEGSEIVISSKFDAEKYRRTLLARKTGEVITTEDLIKAYGKPGEEKRVSVTKLRGKKPVKAPVGVTVGGKVSINTAGVRELQTLPGIGPKRAETIIRYREEHGSFQETSDIMNIYGIGKKTYEGLKDLITVEEGDSAGEVQERPTKKEMEKKVNINTASQSKLESLPGIGPAKAQTIISGRPYTSIEDLDKVPGIGAKTIERLRPYITCE